MVIVVVGFFSAGIAPFMWQLVESYKLIAGIQETSASAKMALEWMTREIREIRTKGGTFSSYLDIDTAEASDFKFTKADGTSVEYRLAGDVIYRNSDILAEKVSSLSFDYRDSDNNTLSPLPLDSYNRKKIHHIVVSVGFNIKEETYTVRSYVVPRDIIMQ